MGFFVKMQSPVCPPQNGFLAFGIMLIKCYVPTYYKAEKRALKNILHRKVKMIFRQQQNERQNNQTEKKKDAVRQNLSASYSVLHNDVVSD